MAADHSQPAANWPQAAMSSPKSPAGPDDRAGACMRRSPSILRVRRGQEGVLPSLVALPQRSFAASCAGTATLRGCTVVCEVDARACTRRARGVCWARLCAAPAAGRQLTGCQLAACASTSKAPSLFSGPIFTTADSEWTLTTQAMRMQAQARTFACSAGHSPA